MKQPNTLTLWASRKKFFLYIAGSLVFVAGGVWMVEANPLVGWAAIIFFGLGALVLAVEIFSSKSYLRLTPEGFTVSTAVRSQTYHWSDVEDFAVSKLGSLNHEGAGLALDAAGLFVNGVGNPSGTDGVCFNFSPLYKAQHPLIKQANKFIAGYEECLPQTYGKSAEQLAGLLREWKDAFG